MPTSEMLTVKLLIDSFISTKGAKFMPIDIKNFYLNTPMSRYEYMRLKMAELPQDFINEYRLQDKKNNMGTCTWKSERACMGYPKQASLHKNS